MFLSLVYVCFHKQNYFLFQYFVFDFNMAPAMLFDKIITLTVQFCYSLSAQYYGVPVINTSLHRFIGYTLQKLNVPVYFFRNKHFQNAPSFAANKHGRNVKQWQCTWIQPKVVAKWIGKDKLSAFKSSSIAPKGYLATI